MKKNREDDFSNCYQLGLLKIEELFVNVIRNFIKQSYNRIQTSTLRLNIFYMNILSIYTAVFW